MAIVLDASCALAALLPDEMQPAAVSLVDQALREGAVVPGIWRLEICNGAMQAHRRGRFDRPVHDLIVQELSKVEVVLDTVGTAAPWDAVIPIALRHGLTTYDACYLELAQRRRLPLATLDTRLAAAAGREQLKVL